MSKKLDALQPLRQTSFDPIAWRTEGRCLIDPALDSIRDYAVYRYASVSEALALCDGRMSFLSPTKWPDKYESHAVAKIFADDSGFKDARPFVKCFSVEYSSEAMWRTYTSKGTGVRIGIGLDDLIGALDQAKWPSRCQIYVGRVRYMAAAKVRTTVAALASAKKQKPGDFMAALLLKRAGFVYENEVRVAIIPKKAPASALEASTVSPDIIRRILLDPYLPEWQATELISVFKDRLPKKIRVSQSEFDRDPAEYPLI